MKMHPLSIKRAVANMVVNAARYGNGWIKVSSGTESHRARFQVEDDGPGIKPEQRKHLFQPFVRGDSARSTSGTGLGLAIVQRIIDNHNGMLEIGTSERGGLSIRARYRFLWLASVGRQRGIRKEVLPPQRRMTPFNAAIRPVPYSFGPALTSASPAGVSVYFSKFSMNSFASAVAFLPLFRRRVGVTRVENGYPRPQFSRDRQIEQRQTEGFRVIKRTVQNGVDNCARIFDGDTFAGAIPAGVNQISLRACCLHTFHQHLSILRRVQRQERGAEAGGEGGVGSVTPRSVPASLAVKPDRKWYCVWLAVKRETGGNTPKASAVRKITLVA